MKVEATQLKEFNNLIPSYLESGKLKTNFNGAYLCPICNRPLTYINGSNHIECEYCSDKKSGKRLIRGYLSLLMFNENLTFSQAYKRATTELELFKATISQDGIKEYSELDKRTIGLTYLNNKENLLSIYENDFINKPLVFTDGTIGELLYHSTKAVRGSKLEPNFIVISNTNYVYNAMRLLIQKGLKGSHKIKLYLGFENNKEGNSIKRHLKKELFNNHFTNFIDLSEYLINHDKEHTIEAHYNNNKDSFMYEANSIINNFNAYYKKPLIEGESDKNEQLHSKSVKTA